MAAVGGRVDQPRAALDVDEPVSGPEVAVQARRGLGVPAQVVEPVDHPVERPHGGRLEGALVACQTGQRDEALRGEELDPRVARLVREPPAAGGPAVLATERRSAGAVQRGERPAEFGLGLGPGRPLVDPLEDQERGVLARGEHLGNGEGVGVA